MWKKLALAALKIGLESLAPKAGSAVADIAKIAEVALPIVEGVSKDTSKSNDAKWDKAMALTTTALKANKVLDIIPQPDIVESGVQLAYSIFKSGK